MFVDGKKRKGEREKEGEKEEGKKREGGARERRKEVVVSIYRYYFLSTSINIDTNY